MALEYRRETQRKNDKLISNLLENLPTEVTAFVRSCLMLEILVSF